MGNTVKRIALIASFVLTAFSSTHAAWYVDRDSTHPNPDGRSWSKAFPTIQPAIDAAHAAGGGEVWIAEGTYNEIRTSIDPDSGVDTGSIVMRDGVGLYGGFAGTEEFRHERNTLRHRTIIDGATARSGEPAHHVIVGANKTELDGLVVTGGGVMGVGVSQTSGGGLYIEGADRVHLRGCTFTGNVGYMGGGARIGRVDDVLIESCTFIESVANGGPGAALYGYLSTFRIVDSIFVRNSMISLWVEDGIVTLDAGHVEVLRCRFDENAGGPPLMINANFPLVAESDFVHNDGGEGESALVLIPGREATGTVLRDSTFVGNISEYNGVAVIFVPQTQHYPPVTEFFQTLGVQNCVFSSNTFSRGYAEPPVLLGGANYVVEHCSFVNNDFKLEYARGAVMHASEPYHLDGDAKLRVRNSILWNPAVTSEFELTGDYNSDFQVPLIDDSIVRGGYEGNEIYTAQPQFINAEDGDFRLAATSPGVDQGQAYSAPEPDILGTPRPAGNFVDLGAFETLNGVRPLCEVADRAEAQFTRLPFAADELTDLDDDGLPDLASLRLLVEAACQYGSPENLSVAAAYKANFEAVNAEPFDMRVLRNREMIAAFMSVSSSAQETLRDALAELGVVLLNDYAVAECGAGGEPCVPARAADAAAVNGPVSGPGDFDADGMSNAGEWAAVLADGGTIDDFVTAATDPTVRGSSHSSSVSATCFIATAAYGTTLAAELKPLRELRDTHLLSNPLGAAFADTYYRLSPPIAEFVARHEKARSLVRTVLLPVLTLADWCNKSGDAEPSSR